MWSNLRADLYQTKSRTLVSAHLPDLAHSTVFLCVIPLTPASSMGCTGQGWREKLIAFLLPTRCKSDRKRLRAFLRGIFNDNFPPLVRVCNKSDQSVWGDMLGQSPSPLKATPPPAEPQESQIHWWCQPSQAQSSAGKVWALLAPYVRPSSGSWRDCNQEFTHGRMKNCPVPSLPSHLLGFIS